MVEPSLSLLTADQLCERATTYREIAATATTEQNKAALLRLAAQFEALAALRQAQARAG
jgi:hypothetical protein